VSDFRDGRYYDSCPPLLRDNGCVELLSYGCSTLAVDNTYNIQDNRHAHAVDNTHNYTHSISFAKHDVQLN